MRTRPALRVFAVPFCLVTLATGSARSEEPETAPAAPPPGAASDRRTLNGHTFLPAYDVRWPFTITSLGADLLLGYGKTTAMVQIRDQTFGGTMEYAAMGAVLGYEYAFLDHFSVRGTIQEVVYSGINGESAVTVGTTAELSFGAGLTASLPLGDALRLGLLFDAGVNPSLDLTIYAGVRSIVDSCSQPTGCEIFTGKIFGTTRVVSLQPAIAASWAPWRPLGLTANVAYLHVGSSGATAVDGDAIRLAVAADYDFRTVSSVPIGLQLQFSWVAPFSGTGLQHVTDLGGGVFYTARQDLAAGVQLISRRFAVNPVVETSWSTFIALLGLRYFW